MGAYTDAAVKANEEKRLRLRRESIKPVCAIIKEIMRVINPKIPVSKALDLDKIINIINRTNIDIKELRANSFRAAVFEHKGLRPVLWKLLLDCLPLDASRWDGKLESNKAQYDKYVSEGAGKTFLRITPSLREGDKLQASIVNDVVRTRTEISYLHYDPSSPSDPLRHVEAISRILYVYSKLNDEIGYIQGMNELVGMIYITFYEGTMKGYESYLESDTFFTFSRLISEVSSHFIRASDGTMSGVRMELSSVADKLQRLDLSVWKKLQSLEINLEFFALRWAITLMTQEYGVEDAKYLMDALICHKLRFAFLQYMIVALIVVTRKDVLEGDFGVAMEALQSASKKIDARRLVEVAERMRLQDIKFIKKYAPKKKKK